MQESRASAPAPHPDRECDRCGAPLLPGEIVVRTHRGMWLLMGLAGLVVVLGFAGDLWLASHIRSGGHSRRRRGGAIVTWVGVLLGMAIVAWGARLGKVRAEHCRACGVTTLQRVGRAGDGARVVRKRAPRA